MHADMLSEFNQACSWTTHGHVGPLAVFEHADTKFNRAFMVFSWSTRIPISTSHFFRSVLKVLPAVQALFNDQWQSLKLKHEPAELAMTTSSIMNATMCFIVSLTHCGAVIHCGMDPLYGLKYS